jgi:enoyl-CoA hydratase
VIHYEIDRGVAMWTLDRPPANAFDAEQLDRFGECLREVRASDATVLAIQADGPYFSVGADVTDVPAVLARPDGARRMGRCTAAIQGLWGELADLEIPTIALLHGAALGGGLELALACDIRIAAASARMGLPDVRLGLVPAAGGTQRLTRLVGPGAASALIFTGQLVEAAEAHRLGIVEQVVADDDLRTHGHALARRIAKLPRAALCEIKRCIAKASGDAGFEAEIEASERLHATPEAAELLRAFTARRPQQVEA